MAKPIPHSFVLDEIADLNPITRPMFGTRSVYIGDKIVLILRSSEKHTQDNGIWLAAQVEHHASLRELFPNLRSLTLFGNGETKWQVLPEDSDDFEESALKICEMVRSRDPRIGFVPNTKLRSGKKKTAPKKKSSNKRRRKSR